VLLLCLLGGEEMAKYRKKPVVVEAVRFFDTAESLAELSEFMGTDIRVNYADPDNPTLIIPTLEGDYIASIGDYIIKGVKGEFYPCKPDIFEMTYEKVDKEGDIYDD
jgi:hypothetical protein